MFCCSFNDKVLDHFMNPRNSGEMENPDCIGNAGDPACGDSLTLYLKMCVSHKTSMIKAWHTGVF